MSRSPNSLALGALSGALLGPAGLAVTSAAAAGVAAVGAAATVWRRGADNRATHGTEKHIGRDEVDALKDAMRTSTRLGFHVGADAVYVLSWLCPGYIKMAKLSLRAYLTHSVESIDNQNAVDGVTVNENSPIDPEMVPGKGNTAPTGDISKPPETFDDLAIAEQDLDGATKPAVAAAEDKTIQKENVNETQAAMEAQPVVEAVK